MGDKVEEAKKKWLSESHAIQEQNKQLLLAFGLNPLEIQKITHEVSISIIIILLIIINVFI